MYNHTGLTASHSTVLAGNANLMQEVWLQYQTVLRNHQPRFRVRKALKHHRAEEM